MKLSILLLITLNSSSLHLANAVEPGVDIRGRSAVAKTVSGDIVGNDSTRMEDVTASR